MTKKSTSRKQSSVVTELYLNALAPISHLSEAERESAIKEMLRKEQINKSLPALNQHILKVGVIDAAKGYTAEDLKRFHDTQMLATRELLSPNDFVSEGSNSITQKKRAQAPRNRKNEDYREIWDYVRGKIRRKELLKSILIDAVEYFADKRFDEQKIRRAIRWAKEKEIS